MSTFADDTQESIALGTIDCPRIGTDAVGAVHYHDIERDRVLVVRNGEIVDKQSLGGSSLATYKEFVAEQRGATWRASGRTAFARDIVRVARPENDD